MARKIEKKKGVPLYLSIFESIAEDIREGRRGYGTMLPSRRAMAEGLGVSQNTVDTAYKLLVDTGYTVSVPRRGYIVSFHGSSYSSEAPWETRAGEEIVFSPNGVDISRINRASYAKLMREVAYNDGIDIFSYVDKGGEFSLRSAVSKYLYSSRGIRCPAERIVIGAGAEYLLASLAVMLGDAVFMIEEPCDTHFYRTLCAYNIDIAVLPQGNDFDADILIGSRGNVLFIDPDSRFPRGRALTEAERGAVLQWVRSSDGRYIVENGSASEILAEQHAPLYAETPDKVVYLGSFARSFSPAVKTSYMVLPERLMEMWKKYHVYYYALTPKSEQHTLAAFIEKGYYAKHCRLMRRVYKEKRTLLKERLMTELGGMISIDEGSGGTYVTARIDGISAAEAKSRARAAGVKLFTRSSYCVRDDAPKDDGLVIGIGDLDRSAIKTGARLLRLALRDRT